MKFPWKEASTLILTALKENHEKGAWNYTVLTVKRSSNSSFMPNSYVFPGGMTELSDSDKNWLDVFSDLIINCNSTKTTWPVHSITNHQVGDIPKLLSLKIAAVRETFEETGILLCACKDKRERSLEKWASVYELEDLELWRSKIRKDSSEFLNLCLHYNCFPDVNNLHFWSNWLTPPKQPKRFDTAFFIAYIHKNLFAIPDKKEIIKSLWCVPEEYRKLFTTQKISLPVPQFYEIKRLMRFKDITALMNFSKNRSEEGCERWMSFYIKTSDGSVILLPGDEAYTVPDLTGQNEIPKLKMTNEEFRLQSKVLHRMEFSNETTPKIIVNGYEPHRGHIAALSDC